MTGPNDRKQALLDKIMIPLIQKDFKTAWLVQKSWQYKWWIAGRSGIREGLQPTMLPSLIIKDYIHYAGSSTKNVHSLFNYTEEHYFFGDTCIKSTALCHLHPKYSTAYSRWVQ